MEVVLEFILPVVTLLVVFTLMSLLYWLIIKANAARRADRKKYLEKRIGAFCESICGHCLFAEVVDFHNYVRICTEMGYKDHEIMEMLTELIPAQSDSPDSPGHTHGD